MGAIHCSKLLSILLSYLFLKNPYDFIDQETESWKSLVYFQEYLGGV